MTTTYDDTTTRLVLQQYEKATIYDALRATLQEDFDFIDGIRIMTLKGVVYKILMHVEETTQQCTLQLLHEKPVRKTDDETYYKVMNDNGLEYECASSALLKTYVFRQTVYHVGSCTMAFLPHYRYNVLDMRKYVKSLEQGEVQRQYRVAQYQAEQERIRKNKERRLRREERERCEHYKNEQRLKRLKENKERRTRIAQYDTDIEDIRGTLYFLGDDLYITDRGTVWHYFDLTRKFKRLYHIAINGSAHVQYNLPDTNEQITTRIDKLAYNAFYPASDKYDMSHIIFKNGDFMCLAKDNMLPPSIKPEKPEENEEQEKEQTETVSYDRQTLLDNAMKYDILLYTHLLSELPTFSYGMSYREQSNTYTSQAPEYKELMKSLDYLSDIQDFYDNENILQYDDLLIENDEVLRHHYGNKTFKRLTDIVYKHR